MNNELNELNTLTKAYETLVIYNGDDKKKLLKDLKDNQLMISKKIINLGP